jgi:hypothetical protein
MQKKYIEDETEKEGEAVGIISASYALGKKKCSEIEEEANNFIKYTVGVCRSERTELNRRLQMALQIMRELQRDLPLLKHSLEAVIDNYHSNVTKLNKYSNEKELLKSLIKDATIQSTDMEKRMKEIQQGVVQSKKEDELIRNEIIGLNQNIDVIQTEITLQVMDYQIKEENVNSYKIENNNKIATLRSQLEAKKLNISNAEKEDCSNNNIELKEELKKITEKKNKEKNEMEKYIRLNAFKTNEICVSKEDIIKIRNDLNDSLALNMKEAVEIEKVN